MSMLNTTSAINQVLDLLTNLRTEEEAITKELEEKQRAIRTKIAAVQTTLELLSQQQQPVVVQAATGRFDGQGIPASAVAVIAEPPRAISANGWAQKLRGLTHPEAL